MTQAFNLALLANKVNSSGLLDASTALNNAVPVANGGLALTSIAARSIPVANSANTYTTVTPAAGQSVRINAGNTAWEAFTPGTGTVTSVATGNGLSGGTITGSGTLTLGAVSINTIGSYILGGVTATAAGGNISYGTTVAGSAISQYGQWQRAYCGGYYWNNFVWTSPSLSGTWMYMGAPANTQSGNGGAMGLWVRIA